MHWHQIKNLQAELKSSIILPNFSNPHAVSLTFTENVRDLHPARLADDLRAQKNVRHFQNLLNRAQLPRRLTKRGLRSASVFVFEFGGQQEGLHCHGIIESPDPDLVGHMPGIVRELWKDNTWWGDQQFKVTPCNEGWVDYILKVKTKPDYAQCVARELWQLPLEGSHYRA